jgi:hypothetical protein
VNDPRHRDPNGGQIYDNPTTGGKIEWNPKQPGKKGSKGKDHWHFTPPGGKRGTGHEEPGDRVKNPMFTVIPGNMVMPATVIPHPSAIFQRIGEAIDALGDSFVNAIKHPNCGCESQ